MRAALALAVAALAGPGLARLLALEAADPLAGTVALVPLVAAGLWQLGRWAASHGGRVSPQRLAVEGILLATWLLLVARRDTLGLPYAEEVLAAGWFLLVGHHAFRLLLALRPSLGPALGRRPPAAFLWLPLLVYLAILPWSTSRRPPDGDEPYYLLVAHSLAYDGDARLGDDYAAGESLRFMPRALEPQLGDPVGPDGETYSRHNVLLPLVLALPYRLAGASGAYLVMAALTALLAWWTLRLARHYAARSPGEVLLAWGLFALAPPLLLYSHQVWVEVPAALLVVVALDAMLDAGGGRRRWWTALAAIALLPLLKLRFAALAAPLALLAWWYGGSRRRLLAAAAAGVALLVGGILLFNHQLYGNALKTYSLHDLAPQDRGLQDYLLGASGLLFDAAFGLVPTAPIWLLVVPALALLAARRHRLLAHLAVGVGPYMLLVASRREWYGGWSPPFRYGLVALPLLALALAPLLAERRRGGARLLAAALAAPTVALALLWLAVPGWTYDLADGGSHLLDHLGRELRADIARFVPSSIRPRAASWLVPAAASALAIALWWRPRRRLAWAPHLGLAAALAAVAGGVWAASHVPTRVVEPEDPWVGTLGGQLHPPTWTEDRLRFRQGWVLAEGDRLVVPLVPGEGEAVLTLLLDFFENEPRIPTLTVRAGQQPLAHWQPTSDSGWQRVRFGPFPWQPGVPLVLALSEPPSAEGRNGLLIDRLEVDWQ
ncbi:MAG TPA: hypothetical protein VMT16_10080 [Thermoanaerobaculia bacterium]|nr:hypothetical protein [Thermoanaerobaculia bacterium]